MINILLLLFLCTFSVTDRIDFVRDVTAYMIVVAIVIGVAYDGNVS